MKAGVSDLDLARAHLAYPAIDLPHAYGLYGVVMSASASLPFDCHTHNALCKHADGTPADYARAAKDKGIGLIAATDHLPNPHGYAPDRRMAMDEFNVYRDLVREAQNAGGAEVLFGIEADFYQGGYQFLEKWLANEGLDLDVVIGGVHHQNYWSDDPEVKSLWEGDSDRIWKRYFRLVGLMADWKLFDVVAHFDLPKKKGRGISDDLLKEYAQPALDAIAENKMAIEINTSGLVHDVAEIYPSSLLLRLAKDRDIPITFGSDAHTPKRVGADFDKAAALARDAGYTEYVIYRGRRPQLQSLI